MLLCGFNATISFIEACFWHLTEPSALVFRFLPVIYLFACLVTSFLFSLNEYFKNNSKFNISWAFVKHFLGTCLVTPSVLSITKYLKNLKLKHKLKFLFFRCWLNRFFCLFLDFSVWTKLLLIGRIFRSSYFFAALSASLQKHDTGEN